MDINKPRSLITLSLLFCAICAVPAIGLAGSSFPTPAAEAVASTDDYHLVWADEFETPGKPDAAKWSYEIGYIRNGEAQYYTDSINNARVEGGNLILEARKEKYTIETATGLNKETADYTSAALETRNKVSWTYGKIEVRARLPKGTGLWPAIWMLGDNIDEAGWPKCGEIDIMEHVGFAPNNVFATIHTQAYNWMTSTQKTRDSYIQDPYGVFHVYSVEWTPEAIDLMLDGVVYNRVVNEHKTDDEWPFHRSQFLILNVAIGGALGGQHGIDDSVFPQRMIVDYVRVYQKNKYE